MVNDRLRSKPEAREAIRELYQRRTTTIRSSKKFEKAAAAILTEHGITREEFQEFYSLVQLAAAGIHACTVFYNEPEYLAGEPAPFDDRYDAQMLPRGSVVVAIALRGGVGAAYGPLYSTLNASAQKRSFWEEMRHALDLVGLYDHKWVEVRRDGELALVPEAVGEKSRLEVLLEKNAYGEGLTPEEKREASALIGKPEFRGGRTCFCGEPAIFDTGLCQAHASYALVTRK